MSSSTVRLNSLRAGIIGTGFIGPVHAEALRRLGISVTAVCDTAGRVETAAERLGIPERHTDYRTLVTSPHVDVVHITAPNRYHHAMALAALAAGKACVCEKPLAMTTAETGELVRAVRRRRAVFAVNYNVRFYPAVLQLRRLVQRGELGEIIHVNGSYFQDWLFKETDYNWRLLPAEGGKLRAVADIGTHWIDTVSFILDRRVARVFADLQTYHRRRQRPLGEVETFARAGQGTRYAEYPVRTEDFASVLLEYRDGPRANLAVSQVAAGRKNCIRLEIYGSRKSAWWNSESPETIGFGQRDGANEIAVRGTPGFGPEIAPFVDYPAGHVEGFPDTFKMLFRDVYGAVAAGKDEGHLFATVEDGHAEVAVCEAILNSSRRRGWVGV